MRKMILVFVLGLAGGLLVSSAVAQDKPGTLTARRLHLVDAEGRVRASITVGEDGSVRTEGLGLAQSEPASRGAATPSMLRAADCLAAYEGFDDFARGELQEFMKDSGWTVGDLVILPAVVNRANMSPAARAATRPIARKALDRAAALLREGKGREAAAAMLEGNAAPK
jgi:hypothetical protein